VFAKNKFANKKEFTGGEILGYFDTIEELAISKFFHKEVDITKHIAYTKHLSKSYPETTRQDFFNSTVKMIRSRLNAFGSMYSEDTSDLDLDTIKRLITDTSPVGWEEVPVSYYTIDMNFKKEGIINNDILKGYIRIIKLKSLGIN